MTAPFAIHWFRRDLRLEGNAVLAEAAQRFDGRVLGVFFFDSAFLARKDFSKNRFAFFLATLKALQTQMRDRGGELLVIDAPPLEGWKRVLGALKPAQVSFNRDYEPFARARDAAVTELLAAHGVEVRTERDHLIAEPHEVLKPSDGTPYHVFTPYARQWLTAMAHADRMTRIEVGGSAPDFAMRWPSSIAPPFKDALESFVAKTPATVPLPLAGHAAALEALERFRNKLENYATSRDIPSEAGTSQLSIYFKNGSLTTAQALAALGLRDLIHPATVKEASGRARFVVEIIWREFYYSILWHHPRVEREAFVEKYRDLKWENSRARFDAWCEGRTGFPIVDAGMRQLRATGWMHNRVRMIVASFLTKDLLVDWRWGDRWFMQQLLDGDLAPNNGGWQWAASTGVDPQPYFRIFNPESQSERFDPTGAYIQQWVPELSALDARGVHAPSDLERASCGYPPPIVDHAEQRARALALFKRGA